MFECYWNYLKSIFINKELSKVAVNSFDLSFRIIIISIFFIITFQIQAFSHPYPQDHRYSSYYVSEIELCKSDLYDYQMNFSLILINSHGFYKNIMDNVFKFTYGARFDNDKIQHRFRFLLVDYQGLFYQTLLRKGVIYRKNSSEYLFHQFGFKILDWNNLELLNSDFTPLRINYDLILENRSHQDIGLNGLNYFPNMHNIYFIIAPFSGISKVNVSNILSENDFNENNTDFWDIDYGFNTKLGYDLKIEKEYEYFDKMGKPNKSWKTFTNSIFCFLNYREFAYNKFNTIEYGLQADLHFAYLIGCTLKYSQNIFSLANNSYEFYRVSIRYDIMLDNLFK